MRGHRHSALVVLLVLLVACAPAATPTPIPTPTPVPTPIPLPTATQLAEGKVSVGDHQLYYHCAGSGSPTVIVEDGFGGAGASSGQWRTVQTAVQESTRICLYDRAPLGKSRATLKVRTSEDVAQDLHKLLLNAPIAGPYVLVGHSMGGWYVRTYAAMHPQEVVGMVLVDAIAGDFGSRILASLPPKSSDEPKAVTDYRNMMDSFWNSSSGGNNEKLNMKASAEKVSKLGSMGDIPLVTLSHNGTSELFSGAGLPKELEEKLERTWQEMQTEQAKLSTKGSLVLATKPNHAIHTSEPQLVIDAILQVVEEARKR